MLGFCYNISLSLKTIAKESTRLREENTDNNKVMAELIVELSKDHIHMNDNLKVVSESLKTVIRQNERILEKLS